VDAGLSISLSCVIELSSSACDSTSSGLCFCLPFLRFEAIEAIEALAVLLEGLGTDVPSDRLLLLVDPGGIGGSICLLLLVVVLLDIDFLDCEVGSWWTRC
jgi:hypothetical protein